MKKAIPVSTEQGIRNLCDVATHILRTMPINAATTYAVRTVIREAVNKSNANYRGNVNNRNVRYASAAARPYLHSKGPTISEHVIPISVLLNNRVYTVCNPVRDTDGLMQILSQYAEMALITTQEDALLRQASLHNKMPDNWDGNDSFARYKAVGIEVSTVPA